MSLSSRGERLRDLPSNDEEAHATGKVMSKFCSFGVVTSRKWTSTYIAIMDGTVKVYDSKETCLQNPLNSVLVISLSKYHRVTPIKVKNYSKDPMKIIDFHCFYIETDNGML